MNNRTGRLDLLLLGIAERIAARNPFTQAVFHVFQQDLKEAFRAFDIPEVKRFIRQNAPKLEKRARKPKLGVKRIGNATRSGKPVEVVEAEWVS